MRDLFIRQHSSDLRGASVVKDENGESLYLVIGKWGIQKDVISVYSMQGELLSEIKQLTLGMLPKFAIFKGSEQVGTISKSFGFFREVIYIRGLNWIIVGNTLRESYRVYHGSQLIFSFHPEDDNNLQFNQLTVCSEEYEALSIAVASVLDHWARRDNFRIMTVPPVPSPRFRNSEAFSNHPMKIKRIKKSDNP
ncbi:hypothetical protein [Paucilactobacillus nenjiangensis]|uniref:LURP-one-related/scramblase family protein n=1 Tax=Paucilactobacillus nenjiangensis TaxID=1296540 RepID=UPI0028D5DED0|nr:hypothetical protein [Paucilactobacillus nenjiangensis]